MRIEHDNELGALHFDGSAWILERRAIFNGVEVPIQIVPESTEAPTLAGISKMQRAAAQLAWALPSDVLEMSAPAVVQNYEVYREMLGDEELPPLRVPSDVWQSVDVTLIYIPPHTDVATPTFLLMGECDWEPEHGLEVRFRNGHADAASQQGELGVDD